MIHLILLVFAVVFFAIDAFWSGPADRPIPLRLSSLGLLCLALSFLVGAR